MIGVDEIVDRERDPEHRRTSQSTHGNNQSEPVDMVSGSHAPQYQGRWHNDDTGGKGPQSLLRFHNALVSTCQSHCEPVAEPPTKEASDTDSDACREIRQTDHGCFEVVRFSPKDDTGGGIEHVEPDLQVAGSALFPNSTVELWIGGGINSPDSCHS